MMRALNKVLETLVVGGELDAFRLTPLKRPEEDDVQIVAISGDTTLDLTDAFLIVVQSPAGGTILLADEHLCHVLGPCLPDGATEAVGHYVTLHREALLKHWRGEIDSLELVGTLRSRSTPLITTATKKRGPPTI